MESDVRDEEKTMAMLCHLSALAGCIVPFGHIIGPLVIWLMKKEGSPFIDHHGKEAVNFQIVLTIYMIIAALLIIVVIGIFILPLLGIAGQVLMIIAAIKAKDGEYYRYPFIFRVI